MDSLVEKHLLEAIRSLKSNIFHDLFFGAKLTYIMNIKNVNLKKSSSKDCITKFSPHFFFSILSRGKIPPFVFSKGGKCGPKGGKNMQFSP